MESKAKILLIEDNQNILLVEKMCLEANGFEVLEAMDGICGLEMAYHSTTGSYFIGYFNSEA